ncbi:General secretion pathway protein K [Bathymodiolus thermophilus thioautotrophic gill symbiont]|uniref:Type II secretion system protein K n=1 Tax=Bathymodiolus thermophilus thioautotrophic gill symbiont TaxID=2360 RepID=A0A1J5TWE6_9GAMM|nr:type II secretion system minor pseudopilin GspK [Bathymodiolus thermophilus thioautotrophic gill symbiont]AYQ56482.1 general secretion pathway protein K [Bathymodiolus thermophilus thioautotrophic gill symbiont]OIR25082.1 hypothetical protein BGC33_12590 [Bathymodiolus thermophilus thioautotrophic gill symbiont]CAB5500904.1 hypothetical protein THERMOS_1288 [Bathymodiolus thermophilus thioautotrophic gill symbiont]CAB5502673.1 hypothetical protein THERMOT_1659 [Bathymodiolus thermophilus thi
MQKSHEKGVVLISVLIIVAMISLVVNMMWQQQALSLKNTENSIYTQQAVNYLYSMESWVKSILKKDDHKIDELGEDWATTIPPIPVPNGTIEGKIFDLQARFNINKLLQTKKDESRVYIDPDYRGFLDMLNTMLEQDYMSDPILEHINAQQSLPKFEHISQLKLVEGISLKNYLKIRPYLYAYENIEAKVNINTASEEVITALYPDSVEEIISGRPFKSTDDVYKIIRKPLTGTALRQAKKKFETLIDIKSDYFLLEANVNINDIHLKAQTLFHRQEKSINIVERTYRQILQ